MKKIILAVGILFLAGCGQQQTSQPAPTTLPAVVPAPVSQPPTDMPVSQSPIIDNNAPAVQTNIYKNTNYGFQITFPTGWENYKVDINSKEAATTGEVYIHFLFPTIDKTYPAAILSDGSKLNGYVDVIAITAWNKSEWDKQINSTECKTNPNPGCPYEGSKLGANAKYVFDISHGNGVFPKDITGKVDDLFKKSGSETTGQTVAKKLDFKLLP